MISLPRSSRSKSCKMLRLTQYFHQLLLLTIVVIVLENVTAAGITPRIVGGKLTTIAQEKSLVQIRRGTTLCGGSLVRPRWVLTAAHCVRGFNIQDYRIIGGTSFLDGADGVTRTVIASFVHPRYNANNKNMDAALLHLDQAMTGTNIQTIAMGGPVNPRAIVRISGWGLTSETGQASNQLKSARVGIRPLNRCRRMYRNTAQITNNMFCASTPGRRDSCSGDSGGPAIFNNRIVGLVSFGAGCARRQYPGVYTKVSSIRPWARQVINNNS